MSTQRRFRRHHAAAAARPGSIHGGRGNDSRTYSDGLNIGWAGGGGGQWGNMVNVAGAQEVVLSTSGGLGEAETGGVILNVIPREGGNTFSGSVRRQRRERRDAGQQLHAGAEGPGPEGAVRAHQRVRRSIRWAAAGSSGTSCGSTLSYRQIATDNTVPGMWVNRNAGNPNAWTVDFDRSRQAFRDNAGSNRDRRASRGRRRRATRSISTGRSRYNQLATGRAAAPRRRRPKRPTGDSFQPSHICRPPGRRRSRAGCCWRPAGARTRRGTAIPTPRIDGTHNPRMIRAQEQGGEIPNLTYRMPARRGRRLQSSSDRDAGEQPGVDVVRHRRAQHEVRLPGRVQQPEPDLHRTSTRSSTSGLNNGVPNRLTQVIIDRRLANPIKVVRNLLPTSFYAQDQWTRNRLTLQGGMRYDSPDHNYPESRIGGPGYTAVGAAGDRLSLAVDAGGQLARRHAAHGRGLRPVRQRQDGRQVQPRQVHGGLHGDQQRPRPEPASSARRSARRGRGPTRTRTSCRTAICRTPTKNGECGAMDNQNLGKEVFNRTYDPGFVDGLGQPSVQLGPGRVGPAGGRAARLGERRLLPQLVGQLVHGRQPGDRRWRTTRRSASRRRSIRGCRAAAARRSAACTTSSRARSGRSTSSRNQLEQLRGADRELAGRGRQRRARLRNGLTVQGGTSTGRRLADACALKAALPEQGPGPRGREHRRSPAARR